MHKRSQYCEQCFLHNRLFGTVDQIHPWCVWHWRSTNDHSPLIHSDTISCGWTASKGLEMWMWSCPEYYPNFHWSCKSCRQSCPRHLNGKLTDMAFHIPTPDVFMVDITCCLKKGATYDQIKKDHEESITRQDERNSWLNRACCGLNRFTEWYSQQHLCLNDNFVKLVSWYDNETGYSYHMVDLFIQMARVAWSVVSLPFFLILQC